jgi:nucleotide-binding universal stress UspA family protein
MSIAPIVAATDFSDASARALARAAQLAALHGVALDLVTVLPATWLGQMRNWLAGAEVQASAAALQARLQEDAETLGRAHAIEVRPRLLRGDVRTELARYANADEAGVLVIGAHGRTLVGEIALGSTALALLQRCAVPLLLVRNAADHAYRKVLAGVAFEPAARHAIERAAALAPGAQFTLLHAYEDPFAAHFFLGQASDAAQAHYRERARTEAEPRLARFAAELAVPATLPLDARLVHGAPGLELSRLAHELGAELVVLGSRRKSRLSTAVLGSVAANVALMAQTDVLLVREGQVARQRA